MNRKLLVLPLILAGLLLSPSSQAGPPQPPLKAKTTSLADAPASPAAAPAVEGEAPDSALEKAKNSLESGQIGNAEQALGVALRAVQAAQGHQFWLLSALAVSLLMFLLKTALVKRGLWDKMGKWKYVLIPALSVLATLLAAFQGGVNWTTALAVFTSSNAMATFQTVYDRVIMGNS
jgi:hypothetical protein